MELNYKTYGQGDPVVILHGLFGTLDNWQTFAKLLAEKFTVFLVDLRNHGRSPHSPEHSYPHMAADMQEFMETNWLYEGAYVIGHSMGGKVAMQMALNYPDLVEKLVVIDMAPKAYVGGHDKIFEALNSLNLSTLQSRKDAEAHLRLFEKDEGTVQFLMKNLSRDTDTGGFEWKMNLPTLFNQYSSILRDIEGEEKTYNEPSLFIRGGRSNYILDSDWPMIQSRFTQAKLITVPDAGHWIHVDQPQLLVQAFNDFL